MSVQKLKENQEIIDEYTNIAKTAGEAVLEQNLGTNSLTPNTRAVINQNVSNKVKNINENVANAISKTKVDT